MTPEAEKALLEYEQLKIQEKEIGDRLDELKPIFMPEVEAGKKYNGVQGKFEVKSRAKWKFSQPLTQKIELLEGEKADEIARGVALNSPVVYIEYRQNKKVDISNNNI